MESAPLNIDTGAEAFAALLDPQPEEVKKEEEAAQPEAEEPQVESDEAPEGDEQNESEEKTFTVMVDGKEVTLTESQIAEAHKSGLRQADYTKKTMEVAETRKAAEAERQQARQERETYAKALQDQSVLLNAALAEQNQIDWQQLLNNDPVEYLKQQHLYQNRQAALQKAQQDYAFIQQQHQAEQAAYTQKVMAEQQEQLLAKLTDWKDATKAKADKQAIKEWMAANDYPKEEIENVAYARHALTLRKAMLYDKMVSKAAAAAKQVQNVPQRVERSGNGQNPNLDKRSSAFQKLSKSGSIEDAAAVFANFV